MYMQMLRKRAYMPNSKRRAVSAGRVYFYYNVHYSIYVMQISVNPAPHCADQIVLFFKLQVINAWGLRWPILIRT
jgi:hypothetical protein